jgi:membrane associated rhomboid family serine protease
VRFLAFYLAGGIVASLAHVATAPNSDVPLVGASGAIAATLGAYVVLFPRARILSLVFLGFFYQLIEVPALLVLGFWFVLQLISGFASLGQTEVGGGVAFFAHIGGFVAGVLAALLIRARGAGSMRRASVG